MAAKKKNGINSGTITLIGGPVKGGKSLLMLSLALGVKK